MYVCMYVCVKDVIEIWMSDESLITNKDLNNYLFLWEN